MNCPSNRLKIILDYYGAQISSIYPPEETSAMMWILLKHFFGIDRLTFSLNPELRLSESELLIFHGACKKILQHIPVQYIIGKVEFFGLPFEVNTSTLIPRPETEELAQLILKTLPSDSCRILDIGTGSGCLAITLKKYHPDCEVFACDISPEALEMARKNAENNKIEIQFFQCDILSANAVTLIPEIDIIVSNPPYVRLSEKSEMRANVLHYDPETALFVSDENPLIFYKAISEIAAQKLASKGRIFFEINEIFGNEVAQILRNEYFTSVQIAQDFRGKDRFVYAWENDG